MLSPQGDNLRTALKIPLRPRHDPVVTSCLRVAGRFCPASFSSSAAKSCSMFLGANRLDGSSVSRPATVVLVAGPAAFSTRGNTRTNYGYSDSDSMRAMPARSAHTDLEPARRSRIARKRKGQPGARLPLVIPINFQQDLDNHDPNACKRCFHFF
jgi:hypothetical protein